MGSIGKPVDGFAELASRPSSYDKVDRGAAVAAAVAMPALAATSVGEDAHWRGAPGLGVVGAGTRPRACTRVARAEQPVGESSQVDPGQDLVPVVAHDAPTGTAVRDADRQWVAVGTAEPL